MPPLSGSNPSRATSKRSSGADSTGSRSTASDDLPCVKCVLVGDGAVGKTSLLASYSKSEHPSPDYIPTAFDNYSVTVNIDGRPIKLHLCDTAGQDELDSLRTLCYSEADVFLVCFSVACHSSYENITAKWLPEIRQHCSRTAPILLVGMQSDLRGDAEVLAQLDRYGERPVAQGTARKLARDVGAAAYVECSAVTNCDVKEVFDAAIFAALDRQGFVRRCRGFGSIRGSKRYRCKSNLWEKSSGVVDVDANRTPSGGVNGHESKRKGRCKFFSCFSK